MSLPERRKDIHWSERATEPSVTVLVRMPNDTSFHQGYYSYGLGEWRVEGFTGDWQVEEWWPLPVAGTGNKV